MQPRLQVGEHLQRARDALFQQRRRQPHAAHFEVFTHVQPGKDVVDLRHVGDTALHQLVGAPAGNALAAVLDRTAVMRCDAEDDLDEGGLAAAVGADDGDELAFVNVERDVLQDLHRAVAAVEPRNVKHPAHPAPPPRPPR